MTSSAIVLALCIAVARAQGSCPQGGNDTTQPCYSCSHQPGCYNVSTAPYTLSGSIAADSPFNEVFTIRNSFTEQLDSACFTFFKKDNNSFVAFRGLVFINGSHSDEFYALGDVENAPGAVRYQGLTTSVGCSTLVTQQCVLGKPCDGLYVFYRCDLYYGNGNPDTTVQDTRFAFSSVRFGVTPSYCYDAAIKVAESSDFGGNNDFYCFPNNLPKRCVTKFNGASCINANLVNPQDAVSLPECD